MRWSSPVARRVRGQKICQFEDIWFCVDVKLCEARYPTRRGVRLVWHGMHGDLSVVNGTAAMQGDQDAQTISPFTLSPAPPLRRQQGNARNRDRRTFV